MVPTAWYTAWTRLLQHDILVILVLFTYCVSDDSWYMNLSISVEISSGKEYKQLLFHFQLHHLMHWKFEVNGAFIPTFGTMYHLSTFSVSLEKISRTNDSWTLIGKSWKTHPEFFRNFSFLGYDTDRFPENSSIDFLWAKIFHESLQILSPLRKFADFEGKYYTESRFESRVTVHFWLELS